MRKCFGPNELNAHNRLFIRRAAHVNRMPDRSKAGPEKPGSNESSQFTIVVVHYDDVTDWCASARTHASFIRYVPVRVKGGSAAKGRVFERILGMSKSPLFERGLTIRKEVLGEAYVNNSLANADEFTRTMAEWSTEFCWGALWSRPGADRRFRSIVNLAMIAAINRPHELKLHVKGAIKNGLSKDEIKEIFLQVAVYCGVPAGIDSFRIAKEAFKELEGA